MDTMIKDTRFEISTYLEEKVTNGYMSLQRELDINGFILCKSDTDIVKLFSCELAVILSSKELTAYNMDTNRETQINGLHYLNTYIEGYKKGELYFEEKWSVSSDTLYSSNSEQYFRDLHSNYFHIRHTGVNEGWGYVKQQFPFILTHKAIQEFGYYSGIVNKVDEQIKKYPTLFVNFEKCDYDFSTQQTVIKTDRLKVNQIALIHFYEGKQITRENAGAIAAEYGYNARTSGEGLFQDYNRYCSTANRKGLPKSCTLITLKNKIELFESVVNYLSDNNKQRAIDEINILKSIFEKEYQ